MLPQVTSSTGTDPGQVQNGSPGGGSTPIPAFMAMVEHEAAIRAELDERPNPTGAPHS